MSTKKKYTGFEVAIVGISCRFPGASNWQKFWDNLLNGVEAFRFLSDDEMRELGASEEIISNKDFVRAVPDFNGKEYFDAPFFDYMPDEARVLGPQNRILHECVWEAFEDAGYVPDEAKGLVGLYNSGADDLNWRIYAKLTNQEQRVSDFMLKHISDKDYLPPLVSYKLNMKGASMNLSSACSSSLLGIHLACRALIFGEVNMAAAGGIFINSSQYFGYPHEEGSIMSKDGHCKAFDKDSSGTSVGEGAAVLVLKRLVDAMKDGDHIYSIIKGSAVNNDGKRKIGLTAPSVEGQTECLKLAQRFAKVDPESIDFIETHGTATSLGDTIEIAGLNNAFKGVAQKIPLGSVKTNIGHLDTAAGVAGVIKAALSLKYKTLPPSLHFKEANPLIGFGDGPFYVNNQVIPLVKNTNEPLRAGVSSLGVGGTNVHTILEEAPIQVPTAKNPINLFTLAAKTKKSLHNYIGKLSWFVKETTDINWSDAAYTFQIGRKHFDQRLPIVFENKEDLLLQLEEASKRNKIVTSLPDTKNTVWMFPGQGAQYPNMGKDLYENNDVFKKEIDKGLVLLHEMTHMDFRQILFPDGEAIHNINETRYAQPLIYLFEYALSKMLTAYGIKPDCMIGHSIGEYVAATLSGVFKFEDALRLLVKRGQLMFGLPKGDMLGVGLPKEEAQKYTAYGVDLATVNGPQQCVLSGDSAKIDALMAQLKAEKINCVKLHTSHAFHSAMLNPILETFEQEVQKTALGSLTTPFVSNLTGTYISQEQASSAKYWVEHMRNTVLFSKGVQTILASNKNNAFLEIGPGRTLSGLVKQHATSKNSIRTVNFVRRPKQKLNDVKVLTKGLGQAWALGIKLDWKELHQGNQRYRIPLPTYAFEQIRFPAVVDPYKLLGKLNGTHQNDNNDPNQYIYHSHWKTASPNPHKELLQDDKDTAIIFSNRGKLAESLNAQLTKANIQCINVFIGNPSDGEENYSILPDKAESYQNFFEAIKNKGIQFSKIYHTWTLEEKDGNDSFNVEQAGYQSVLQIVKNIPSNQKLQLEIIGNELFAIETGETATIEKTTILEPAKAINRQYANINCRILDCGQLEEGVSESLWEELKQKIVHTEVALRGKIRYVKSFEQIHIGANSKGKELPVEDFMVEKVERPNLKSAYVEPITEVEKELVNVLENYFGVSPLGLEDDIFELGVDSLKLMVINRRLLKAFNRQLPIDFFYDNPIIGILAEEIEARKLVGENQDSSAIQSIPQLPLKDSYEVSSGQRRMWISSQFTEASLAHNYSEVYEIEGQLNPMLLSRAFDLLIERHEILRTVFRQEQSDVRQHILSKEELGFEITFEDLRDAKNAQKETLSKVQKEISTPFNLENGPLVRGQLIQTTNNKYVFSYVIHHIITDGWSMVVLIQELFTVYAALLKGENNPLKPLHIQYKDYAAWHNTQLSEENLKEHKEFWLEQFEGELSRINLPIDKVRPSQKTYNGDKVQKIVGQKLTSQFKDVLQQENGSLFMGFLAVVNTLFYKYAGQEDIIIGTPVAGREHSELENQLGFYVNTLALRTRFEKENSFPTLLQKVKQNTLKCFEHQIYPFDKLMDELKLEKDRSRSPLFDVFITAQYDNLDDESAFKDIDGLKFKTYEDKERAAVLSDLYFEFGEIDGSLYIDVYYNTDLFHKETVERLGEHLEEILKSIVSNPEQSIERINYLSEQEKHQIGNVFNSTKLEYGKDKTILDLYHQQVQKTPEAIAVEFEGNQLAFQEIDKYSTQFATYLIDEYQIAPNDFVAIQLERSEWMLVSILAILKCGAAYVPIDPAHPEDRVAYIQKDSHSKLCIDRDLLEKIKPELGKQSGATLLPNVQNHNIAYAIYTSGSTGEPKGVVNDHAGLYNRLLWMRNDLQISEKDVLLQKTPYTFDVSVWELLMPLITGSKLVFAKPEGHKDPYYLQELIKNQSISIIHFVPSMLEAFIPVANLGNCGSLNHLVCSGEALSLNLVESFRTKLPTCRIHNLYGPTEAAIDVTAIDLTEVDLSKQGVPIGKTVPNTQIYIVDAAMNWQAVGVPGELLIGGVQVARGYLNKEELNKEKFIPNPFGEGRVYRTGDLAKWLPDGNIAYIARMDNQVKIRGNRVELGEIENILEQLDSVQQSAVLVKEDQAQNKRLVAYILSTEKYDREEVYKQLNNKLPSYMVPSFIMELDEFPLTSSGKLNRKMLPEPDLAQIIKQKHIAPKNETEKKLVDIWQKELGHHQIGILDNFFHIGGDSIIAIRVISQTNQSFKTNLKVNQLYESNTIEALSEVIAKAPENEQENIQAREDVMLSFEALKSEIFNRN